MLSGSCSLRLATICALMICEFAAATRAHAGVLVSNYGSSNILLFSDDLSHVQQFVPAGSGGLASPVGMALRNGDLYVSSQGENGYEILRYNATTGGFIEKFADGPADSAPGGIAWGPDGNLYAANFGGESIDRLTGPGAPAPFATGMSSPDFFEFDSTGLFVSDFANQQISKFNPTTGQVIKADFATGHGLLNPGGLHIDTDGTLYAVSLTGSLVLHYDTDGSFLNTFIDPGSFTFPSGMLFAPNGDVYLTILGPTLSTPGFIRRYSQTAPGTDGNTGVLIGQATSANMILPGNVIYAPIFVDPIAGDMDGDGDVDNFDIQPFELALTDPDAWHERYPFLLGLTVRGDIDDDGDLDNFDIQPFEDLLTSGATAVGAAAVPEPSSLALAGIAALLVAVRNVQRRRTRSARRDW